VRAVVQRAARASVSVDGREVASFAREGLVALVGVTHGDSEVEARAIARKIAELRILTGETSAAEGNAPVIVISQFTLYADTRKGRRPSWNGAAPAAIAEPLVDAVAADLRARGLEVGMGVFGAHMIVELVGDGPVTLVLDS
jgi:D-tyrosyl-tRNA(Tyr) deacylase